MANRKDVQELAQKLDKWAKDELKKHPEQQYLLKCLLSRGAYTELRANRRLVVGVAGHLGADDIRQAVIDALAPVIRDLPDPIEGWARFSPWPRFGDWPRDGYWALGMGPPPRDLMHPEDPRGRGGPVGPEGPGGLGGPEGPGGLGGPEGPGGGLGGPEGPGG